MVSSLSPTPKTKLKGVWQTGKSISKQTKWRANSLQLKRKISNYTNTDIKMCKGHTEIGMIEMNDAWGQWGGGEVRSWPIFPLMESHSKTFHGGLFTSTLKSLQLHFFEYRDSISKNLKRYWSPNLYLNMVNSHLLLKSWHIVLGR